MEYKHITYSVARMVKDVERKEGDPNRTIFEIPIQRPSDQWDRAAQSLLIHTLMQGYCCPEIYIVHKSVDSFQPKIVLDGKQRLTTVYDYVKGKFPLSRNTPPVVLERVLKDSEGNMMLEDNGNYKTITETIQVGGKKFHQLPPELQEKILDFEFAVRLITRATTEELENQMFRLNNGKAQTATQKAIIAFGIDFASEITRVAANNFIFNRLVFGRTQRKNSEDLKIVLNSFAVLNDYSYKKLSSAADLVKIANLIKEEGWTETQMDYLLELFNTLDKMLPDVPEDENTQEIAEDVFRTPQIPVLIRNVDTYLALLDDGKITKQQYRDFLAWWCSEGFFAEEYQAFCGKSVNDKSQVDSRIDYMEKKLLEFIGGDNDVKDPVKVAEGLDESIDITSDDVKTFIETVTSEHHCDEETALRILESVSNYQPKTENDRLGDFLRYIEDMSQSDLSQLADKALNMALKIPTDVWSTSADDAYDTLMWRADYTNSSETERLTYLINSFNRYVNNITNNN